MYLNQGVRGFAKSYRVWARVGARSMRMDELSIFLGDMAEVALWANMLYVSSLLRQTLSGVSEAAIKASEEALAHAEQGKSDATKLSEEAQETLEMIDLMQALEESYKSSGDDASQAILSLEDANQDLEEANLKLKLAEAAETKAKTQAAAADRELTDAQTAERQAIFAEVVDIVVLENAPSLLLTAGFFALRLHAVDPPQQLAIIKVVSSICLSAASALHKAVKVVKFGIQGKSVFCLICLLVAYTAVKTVMVFFCGSGFFSLQSMRCDRKIQ